MEVFAIVITVCARSLWTASIFPANNEARSSSAESDEEGRVVRDLRRKETTGNVWREDCCVPLGDRLRFLGYEFKMRPVSVLSLFLQES